MDDEPRVAVIGVVVVRTRQDDDVGFRPADRTDHLVPHLERWLELAVVVVEHPILRDAKPAARLLGLRPPPLRERSASLALMPRVTVGERQEPDLVAELGPVDGGTARAGVGVVRVSADHEDIQGCDEREHGRGIYHLDAFESVGGEHVEPKTARDLRALARCDWNARLLQHDAR